MNKPQRAKPGMWASLQGLVELVRRNVSSVSIEGPQAPGWGVDSFGKGEVRLVPPDSYWVRPSRQEPAGKRVAVSPPDPHTPFIHDDLQLMRAAYHGHAHEPGLRHGLVYTDIQLLHRGGEGFPSGTEVRDIRIEALPEAFALSRDLEAHRKAAEELMAALGKLRPDPASPTGLQNDRTPRICSWGPDGRVRVQRSEYRDQVGTSLVMDWASGLLGDPGPGRRTRTLRNFVERPVGGRLTPFHESRLANGLGVAALVQASDGFLVSVRGFGPAVMTGAFHCSASGVAEWYFEPGETDATFERFERAMRFEIHEELGLEHNQHEQEYELIPLAFARELPRGGHPQLFFLAKTALSRAEVEERAKQANEAWEFVHDPEELPARSPLRAAYDDRHEALSPAPPAAAASSGLGACALEKRSPLS